VIVIIIGVMAIYGASTTLKIAPEPELSPAQQASKLKEEAMFQRSVAGARQLRSSMRNPDSFKLSQALVMSNGAVCYTYRAQNGFGGMNVGYAVLASNDRFKSSDSPGHETLWNKECGNKSGTDDAETVNVALNMAK
jgi:hypothetical protein